MGQAKLWDSFRGPGSLDCPGVRVDDASDHLYFPDRWEVTDIESRQEGEVVKGAMKIHCHEDDKVFLSDFSAKLDAKGKLSELSLDGVSVGKFVGKLHTSTR